MTTSTIEKKIQSPEHKAASDQSKKGFEVKIEGKFLITKTPIIERESTSGKTMIVANCSKMVPYGEHVMKVQTNSYYYL